MKRFLLSIIAIVMGGFMIAMPVFAECPDGYIPTSIIGNEADIVTGTNGERCLKDTNGSGIKNILKLVVNVMSVGVGILAVIGIVISGMQYLTAGGSEEKTRKAKRRIVEIVIGIAVFVLIYAALNFLVPDFNPSL